MNNKVVVIGIDAACFERIQPFLNQGQVPYLKQLFEQGGGTSLETTTPPWTPSAWPSLVTGSDPQTHGVYDFFNHNEDYSHELVSARDIRVPYLWEYLSEEGLSSIVVNVPVTHPAHHFDGSIVPGYLSPDTPLCLVDGKARPVEEIAPDYRIYADNNDPNEETLREYETLVQSRATVTNQLMDRHDWSFLMVQFQRTDSVYHTFGDNEAASARVYSAVDDAIGRVLDHVDEGCNILVVSDHGIWQYDAVFYINTWLKKQGYLETSPESKRIGWNATTKRQLKADHTEKSPGLSARLGNSLVDLINRFGLSPQAVESMLTKIGLDRVVRNNIPLDVLEDSIHHVDWPTSRAYCRSTSSLGLRFNVKGRERNGVVHPDDFDAARQCLIDELEAIESPGGQRIFEEVWDRHEEWGADVRNESSAPDVLYRPRDMRWEVSDIVKSNPFEDTEAFNHNYEGLLIAAGPDIEWDDAIQPHVTDVAPTILSLLGLSPPDTMDGGPLDKICATQEAAYQASSVPDRTYVDNAAAERDQIVEERLRDMGYME